MVTGSLFQFYGPRGRVTTVEGLTVELVAAEGRRIGEQAFARCAATLRRHGVPPTPELREAFVQAVYARDRQIARALARSRAA